MSGSRLLPSGAQAEEDGYVIVEDLLAPEECRTYRERLDDYAHGSRTLPAGLAIQREPRVARGELAAQSGDDVRKISGVAHGDVLFRALVLHPTV
jgi:hypothetical protein